LIFRPLKFLEKIPIGRAKAVFDFVVVLSW
jgi:hypothetical protein